MPPWNRERRSARLRVMREASRRNQEANAAPAAPRTREAVAAVRETPVQQLPGAGPDQATAAFHRAVAALGEAAHRANELSDLEKDGAVKRFETAVEGAWTVLRAHLESEGAPASPLTPRTVFVQAAAARIIPDASVWIDMLERRALLARPHDANARDAAMEAIQDRYYPALAGLAAGLEETGAEDALE